MLGNLFSSSSKQKSKTESTTETANLADSEGSVANFGDGTVEITGDEAFDFGSDALEGSIKLIDDTNEDALQSIDEAVSGSLDFGSDSLEIVDDSLESSLDYTSKENEDTRDFLKDALQIGNQSVEESFAQLGNNTRKISQAFQSESSQITGKTLETVQYVGLGLAAAFTAYALWGRK